MKVLKVRERVEKVKGVTEEDPQHLLLLREEVEEAEKGE